MSLNRNVVCGSQSVTTRADPGRQNERHGVAALPDELLTTTRTVYRKAVELTVIRDRRDQRVIVE